MGRVRRDIGDGHGACACHRDAGVQVTFVVLVCTCAPRMAAFYSRYPWPRGVHPIMVSQCRLAPTHDDLSSYPRSGPWELSGYWRPCACHVHEVLAVYTCVVRLHGWWNVGAPAKA